ncbi:MAG: hypothetical protein Q7S39_04440 [Ignavibacteria bacterium]|nr:hypothetical protein [Ignavibacteria bacterium]
MSYLLLNKIKRISKVIAAIVLLVIAIVFIHSELGQCGRADNNYSLHDYCIIVKGANVQSTNAAANDLLKLKVEKSICFHCINKTNEHISSYIKLDFEQFHTPQQTTEVYLFNRMFLI